MAKKMRYCCYCGAEMGEIEDRYYERTDTCGSAECNCFAADDAQAEREERHRQLDEDMGW